MTKRKGPTPKRTWVEMKRTVPADPESFRRHSGRAAQMWDNDRYTVIVECQGDEGDWAGPLWLSIRRNDRKAIRDWRDFQRIKNDIAGPEREAIELFPAESRLVDTANQYHLWVLPEGQRVQVGWTHRIVADGESYEIDGEAVSLDDLLARINAAPEDVAKSVQRPLTA